MIQNFVIESHELLTPSPAPQPARIKYSFATREQQRAAIRLRLEAMCRELRGNLILFRRCIFQLQKARSNAIGRGQSCLYAQTDRQTEFAFDSGPWGRRPYRTGTANGLVNARPSADASIPPDWICGTHDSSLNLLSGPGTGLGLA